jgi:hypothetical protein
MSAGREFTWSREREERVLRGTAQRAFRRARKRRWLAFVAPAVVLFPMLLLRAGFASPGLLPTRAGAGEGRDVGESVADAAVLVATSALDGGPLCD